MVKIFYTQRRPAYFTTTAKYYCNEIGTSTSYHTPSLYLLQIIILLITISISFQFTSYTYINQIYLSKGHIDHRIPSPLTYQQLSTTVIHATSKHQYEIGDKVLLINNDDGASYQSGIIEQKKGGWYTICIEGNSNNRVKRRASQLIQKRDTSVVNEDSSTLSSDDITSSSTEEMETSLPPVDIIDLDSILQHPKHESNSTVSTETIQQITNIHTHYKQWILFSDLHVMPSTISTCLKVLNYIHNIAIQQTTPTGILFLGDFWHHRGFVRVDCLNSILDCMAKWKVPCIMIPGNHDQIDWKGVEHALTPLGNAYRLCSPNNDADNNSLEKEKQQQQIYPGPLIITHPTKLMNALFIPHIRDKHQMKSILSSNEAQASNALFVHADVKGASMNDMITSQHGLDGSVFPSDKLIYSGHFHKPHIVKKKSSGVTIRYVGSPYQTSYSESGQVKSLLLVDATQNWQCIQEIPIDIGPRYHRIPSVQSFIENDVSEMKFRKGDKVAVTVCQNDLDEMRLLAQEEGDTIEGGKTLFDAKLEKLRDAGISVEIRDVQSQDQDESQVSSSLVTEEDEVELEDLSPKATLTAYLDNEVGNGDLGEATAKKLLEMGEELLGESSEDASQSSSPSSKTTVSELEIESVSIKGFGSFRQETVYPLHNRGVVLLRGTNKDFGSDSNGVGKSTLAMSSLWALAGSIDPRPTQDGKVTDVVNDFSKVAEVTLIGSINSMPFQVKRMKSTSSKGSSLSFTLNGSDLTRQSSKDTQQLIDEHFGIGSQMLMRTIFHGQHTIGGLLESSDAKLKEELSYLVSLEIWQESASRARSKQRELRRKASEIEGMLSLREKDKARAEDKSQAAKAEMKRREGMLENERRMLSEKEQSIATTSESEQSDIESAMESVQTQLNDCGSEINSLEKELSKILDSGSDELDTLRSKLNEQREIENDAKASLQACQRKHDIATMELKPAESQLAQLQSEWDMNIAAEEDIASPKTCKTCGQPIISLIAQKHVMESIKKKLSVATSEVDKARETVSDVAQSLEEAEVAAHMIGLEVQSSMKLVQEAKESRATETDDLRQKISASRIFQATLSAEFTSLAKRAKEMSEFNLVQSRMQANLDRLSESFNSSVVAYRDCCSEVEMIETNILELEKERETLTSTASLFTLLRDSFGPKGIQAFVLRNIVQALQYCSQTYLNELSDGSLQLRMQVGSNDSIIKQAAVRNLDGTWRVRPLSSLSGGQWRRCSLALSLSFIDLASKRGKLRSSLLVLDEPLTHLDSSGRQSVGKLLRKMLRQDDTGVGRLGLSTILVILQEIAAEEIEECFDQIDEVIKQDGESYVVLDENQEHR